MLPLNEKLSERVTEAVPLLLEACAQQNAAHLLFPLSAITGEEPGKETPLSDFPTIFGEVAVAVSAIQYVTQVECSLWCSENPEPHTAEEELVRAAADRLSRWNLHGHAPPPASVLRENRNSSAPDKLLSSTGNTEGANDMEKLWRPFQRSGRPVEGSMVLSPQTRCVGFPGEGRRSSMRAGVEGKGMYLPRWKARAGFGVGDEVCFPGATG